MPLSAVIFLVGFTAGCVLAFVRNPVYGLMTYIATLYFDPAGQWWGRALPIVRWELIPAAITRCRNAAIRAAPVLAPAQRRVLGICRYSSCGRSSNCNGLSTPDAQEQLVTHLEQVPRREHHDLCLRRLLEESATGPMGPRLGLCLHGMDGLCILPWWTFRGLRARQCGRRQYRSAGASDRIYRGGIAFSFRQLAYQGSATPGDGL